MEVALFTSAEPEKRAAQVTGSYALPEKNRPMARTNVYVLMLAMIQFSKSC